MLPPGVGPLAGGLKEDSKFCAELFLRIVGRGTSDIGGLDREMADGKPAILVGCEKKSSLNVMLIVSELGYAGS